MTTIPFPTSMPATLTVHSRSDVLIVGGGPSGFGAALAAARAGASVTLLERSGMIGGAGTLNSVAIWMDVGTLTGIYGEICRELAVEDVLGRSFADTKKFVPQFDPHVVRWWMDKKLREAGVQLCYHCHFLGADYDDETLRHVVALTPEGMMAFAGKTVIDCTGNAAVCRATGVETTTGRSSDGLTQPMTMMFQMVDTGAPQRVGMPEALQQHVPHYATVEDTPQGRPLHWYDDERKTLLVNMTRVAGHGSKLDERSRAEAEGMSQVLGVAQHLQRTSHPHCTLSHVASEIGVRETYQIIGEYTMTGADVTDSHKQPDVICQGNYGIDIHNPTGDAGCHFPEHSGHLYDIPWRSLLPAQGPRNLCVAGRHLSANHEAMAGVRVQALCMGMGEATGIAAALAAEKNISLREVPYADIRLGLEQSGVVFE